MNAMTKNQKLVEAIRNQGQAKGLVEAGDTGHKAIWNMMVELMPEESFQAPPEVSWYDMLLSPIVKQS
jgi:hypothetical protein